MSFCTQIKDELASLHPKATCCRKALIYGLLYGSELPRERGEGLSLHIPVPAGATVDYAAYISDMLRAQLNTDVSPQQETRGAHRYLHIRINHKQAVKTLTILSEATEADHEVIPRVIGLRCKECNAHFLRGIFLASGTVNDPSKSYHLEIRTPADGRADLLCALLMQMGSMPGSTRRREDVGFIWKSSSAVIELLNLIGATSGVFDIFNTQIEREIRNNENRATNCVTENIGRSISAAAKQTSAIRYLEENHLIPSLSPDLQITAALRLEHPEATLKELAELHEPPITKSGLNHRMEKILAHYEKALHHEEKKGN